MKLDLGLRYDYLAVADRSRTTSSSRSTRRTSSLVQHRLERLHQVTKNGSDFQPRVGVIWNPTGDGKLVVRGAYAVMVNQSNTGYFVGEANNPPLATPLSDRRPARPRATSSSTAR